MHKRLDAIARAAFAVAAASGPHTVSAQDALATCAQVQVDAQRLACYDQLAGRSPDGAAAPAAAAKSYADFGLLQPAIRARDPGSWVESVTAQVTGVTRNAEGRLVLALDNGQVWAQSETKSSAVLKPGDQVTIKRAALGSFMLVGPRSVSSRVRRVR